jgi:hypothetical protein
LGVERPVREADNSLAFVYCRGYTSAAIPPLRRICIHNVQTGQLHVQEYNRTTSVVEKANYVEYPSGDLAQPLVQLCTSPKRAAVRTP